MIKNKYTAYTKNGAIEYTKNTTLNPEAVRDAIPVLFELLRSEEDAGTRAVLGHFIFVYVHPYMDYNGRIGRFAGIWRVFLDDCSGRAKGCVYGSTGMCQR